MIKRILFVFFLTPLFAVGQIADNFESGDISGWMQNASGRWDVSNINPIEGANSLKHIFDTTAASNDQISIALPAIDFASNNISWRFRIRHSYAPSSSNNWTVFLAADTTANQMFPGGLVNGYAIGVNFTGFDDLLKLFSITNGAATTISITTVNWEDHVGTSLAPAIEVVRYMNGSWEVRFNKEGDFENLAIIASGSDLTFTSAKYFGIFYKYSLAQDLKLWFDEFYFGKEILDTIKPTITDLSIESSKVLSIEFSEKIDSVSAINKLNFNVSGGIGNADSIIFDSLSKRNIRLMFNSKFENNQQYKIDIQNIKDISDNSINDTSIFFEYEYIKPLYVSPITTNQLEVKFSRDVDTISGKEVANYFLNNGAGNPETVIIKENDSSIVWLKFADNFINKTQYSIEIQHVADLELDSLLIAEISFLYYVPEPNDIVINEIMADPSPEVNLPNFEYVEIYNTTPFSVDITNWIIQMGTTQRVIPAYMLNPDSYLILCSPTATTDLASYGDTLGVNSFPTITNSGSTISLLSPDSVVISKISFTTDWYNDNSKIDGGWSIERIDPLNTCSQKTNWKASVHSNGGTPGVVNSVYAQYIDSIAPYVENIEIISSNQLRITFSEVVDTVSAMVKENYLVNESVGEPFSLLLSADQQQVDLFFIHTFPQTSNLVLTVKNLEDECKNKLDSQLLDFSYYIAQPHDVVINEIMADPDPAVYLPDFEFIEIYNKTDFNIDLSGWSLIAGTTIKPISVYTLKSKSQVILCSESAYQSLKDYGYTHIISGFPSLSNSGQSLTLKNKQGSIISTVTYQDSWYKNSLKTEGGWSLEQIDPDNPCGGESNWTASVNADGGTPGKANSVLASNPDLIAPELIRATVINSNSIRLFFNETIDSISASNLSNYFVDNNLGSPDSIAFISPDYFSLILVFNEPFAENAIYTIEIMNGVTDCSGNEIGEFNKARFAIPAMCEFNDLIINELLFNPRTGGYDFIELYNRSQKTFDLKELRIAAYDELTGDYSSVEEIAVDGFLVFPGDYVVLTENPAIVRQHYYTSNERGFLAISSLPSYNDDEGKAILMNQNESVIDMLDYNQDMHFPLLTNTDGVSLERINPDRPSEDASNWHSASEVVGFATPAYENSQYKSVSETDERIKISPEVFSPDNDGFEDVIDIQLLFDNPGYVANIKVFDSRGRLIKYIANNLLLGVENTISWNGLNDQNQKPTNGIYVIYFEIFDLRGNVKKYRKSVVIAEKF
ncbi:MAG: lamin tail domain-containing protein [Bacteroidales bacterium]